MQERRPMMGVYGVVGAGRVENESSIERQVQIEISE
jgi:hypothetical protein